MNRETEPNLKPGTVYGASTIVGPGSPEYDSAHRRYVRVECWSCKERRDVSVNNLVGGKSKRCRGCAHKARNARRYCLPGVE